MSDEIRDFLEIEKRPTSEMKEEELASEVEGWRSIFSMLPRECLEWLARLHGVVRFTKRNYQGSTGILIDFKMEATSYSIAVRETAFDSLQGKRIIEDKILDIPAAAVMYAEFIGDVQEYDPMQADEELAGQEIA